jgi:MFS family permease
MVGAFTSWFLWPVYLTEVWNYSKLSIGLAFTPAPVISALVAILSGRWADKHGFRGLMGVAAFLAASGHIWLFFFLNETINFWFSFFPATVLFGLGMGVLASQLNSAALLAIPAKSIATANGIHQSLRYAVGAMGAATAIAILNGTHDVWRYDLMWLLLAGMQMAVIPLMLFAYPKSTIKN